MANQWFRLWHDMPNDPKWRTIARVSGRPISEVISVYLHLLNSASQSVTRGNATVTAEDLASAIDTETEHVEAIFSAMQGRVLEGNWLTGWDKRQVKKEEDTNPESRAKSNAERQREYRERKRQEASNDGVTASNEASRNVTTDKDKDKDTDNKNTGAKAPALRADDLVSQGVPEDVAAEFLALRKAKRARLTPRALAGIKSQADAAGYTLAQALTKCIERGWTGFEAAWVASLPKPEAPKVAEFRWWEAAGFRNEWEAQNFDCTAKNYQQFRNGRRVVSQ